MAEAPTRVRFFEGMLLSAEDLLVEQDYCRRMRYLHNRLHGHGIVKGLGVTVSGSEIRVGPGWAIDELGREVVLTKPRCLDAGEYSGRTADLVLSWAEVPAREVPGPDGSAVPTRWIEDPELELSPPDEAAREGLVLARIKRGLRGRLAVDTSMRRPLNPPL